MSVANSPCTVSLKRMKCFPIALLVLRIDFEPSVEKT